MELIEKTLKYGGTETTVFFKELTGGDKLQLARGQKFTTTKEGGSFEVDLGDQLERGYKLVQLTLVNDGGKKVYSSINDLLKEPSKKLKALVDLANEVHREDEEGNA